MVWFRENWYEEVLRQLRAGLAKCYVVSFHHRAGVADATVTPHTLNFIKKVVSTFGIGIGISELPSHARTSFHMHTHTYTPIQTSLSYIHTHPFKHTYKYPNIDTNYEL